jgi:outer membrane protein
MSGKENIMKTIVAVFLVLALCGGAVKADEAFGVLTYEVSVPQGQLKDYIDKTSWRGFGLEGRWLVTPNITLGAAWHWNTFYKTTDEMIELENGHVTGNQFRIVYGSPLMATGFWYPYSPLDNPSFMPYLGLGAGAIWMKERLEIGIIAFEESNWHFGLQPEAGIMFPVGYYTNLLVSARYTYAFESGDAPEYQWWSFGFGFAWTN